MNFKLNKKTEILKKITSIVLILLINLSNLLVPIVYTAQAQSATGGNNEIYTLYGKKFLEREFGAEQLIEFEYDTLDNYSPVATEYVHIINNQRISATSSSGTPSTGVGTGSSFIGPHVAGLNPDISAVTGGKPVVAIINTENISTANYASFTNADPLVIRIDGDRLGTSVAQAQANANAIANLGLPAGTIVVYGNEVNNIEVEWDLDNTSGRGSIPSVEEAAEQYAEIFIPFAEIINNAGLRAAPSPADLYNSFYSGAAWVSKAKEKGVYDAAQALVANAYEIPSIKGIEEVIDELEALTEKPVDFITEIGPHPTLGLQEHIDFLNNVTQPLNSAGRPLQASTLIPNNCGYRSDRDQGFDDYWLFYSAGKVYDMKGAQIDPAKCGGSGGSPALLGPRTEAYDATTVVGTVVSNVSLPDENDKFKPNVGIEGYVVATYEHIDFGETSYFNWTHITTTNKNGKFAIPIDKRGDGAFLVILKPLEDGFRLINSYDISRDLQEDPKRRTENGIITLGEIEVGEDVIIKDLDETIKLLPEFIRLYQDKTGTITDNYYSCTDSARLPWENFDREFEVNLDLEDAPFTYDIANAPGSINGKFLDKENTFEILTVDGVETDLYRKERSLECINTTLSQPVSNIAELGDEAYFDVFEGDPDAPGNNCFSYNEPFIPLTDKYLYTNFKVKQGLVTVNYLKSASVSSTYYNGPTNYINPLESNNGRLPDCDKFYEAVNFQNYGPGENRRTYAGLSNLTLPQTLVSRYQSGVTDITSLATTYACIDDTVRKTYAQLLQEGIEIPEKFFLDMYLGHNGDTNYTDLSTIVNDDSIQNPLVAPPNGIIEKFEEGRETLFKEASTDPDNEKSNQPSATWAKISDVEIENKTIFGDGASEAMSASLNYTMPAKGFYHTFLHPFAQDNESTTHIYEIGPQKSLCKEIYQNSGKISDKLLFTENDKVTLTPYSDPDSAYTGWLLDNKNLTTNKGEDIIAPEGGNNWLFSSFFGDLFIDEDDTRFQKITDRIYLTFDHYLKSISSKNEEGTGQVNTLAGLISKAYEDDCLNISSDSYDGWEYLKKTKKGPGYVEKLRQIDEYCVGSCENILWKWNPGADCNVYPSLTGPGGVDSATCVYFGSALTVGGTPGGITSGGNPSSLPANSSEIIQKFSGAAPLVIRLTDVDYTTTPEQATSIAESVVELGLPAGTIVVYGNELNNLFTEWGTVTTDPGTGGSPVSDSLIKQAATKYASLFKNFADVLKENNLRPAPAPPDLYNGIFSGEVWVNQAKLYGVYDDASAIVANAYEIPEIMTAQQAVDKLETLTGETVDFLTEFGPHPRENLQTHLDFLNSNNPPNGLKASTLVPNKANFCNHDSDGNGIDSWLFYINGGIYNMKGELATCEGSSTTYQSGTGNPNIGPHEAGLSPDIDVTGLPVVVMLGSRYSGGSGGGSGGGGGSFYTIPSGWQEIKIATEIQYTCEGKNSENEITMEVQDIKSNQERISETRSLNQNAILMRDSLSTPFKNEFDKPYTIGKKRVELYSFLENKTDYGAKDDVSANEGPIASILTAIGNLFGITKPIDPISDENVTNLTYVKLINDTENLNTEPAGSNLDWLRLTSKLPIPQQPLEYNKVVYRDINYYDRIQDRVLLNAGSGSASGTPGTPQPPINIDPIGCPVACNPIPTCYSYTNTGKSCRHGSDDYWNYVGNKCQFPIPGHNFPGAGKLPYAPAGYDVQTFCGANYNASKMEHNENRDKYGFALDVVTRCTDKFIIAPPKRGVTEWRVIYAKEIGGDRFNSYIVLEADSPDGTIRLYLLHLDSDSFIEFDIARGDVVSPGETIARYSDISNGHLHIEVAIDGDILRPEDYFLECTGAISGPTAPGCADTSTPLPSLPLQEIPEGLSDTPDTSSTSVPTNSNFYAYLEGEGGDKYISFSPDNYIRYISFEDKPDAISEYMVRPKGIILHWDGNPSTDRSDWIRDTTYNGLLRNDTSSTFAVGEDGVLQMALMTEDKVQITHATSGYSGYINIEIAGSNFDDTPPSASVIRQTRELIIRLMKQYNLQVNNIYPHYELDDLVIIDCEIYPFDPAIHDEDDKVTTGKTDPGEQFFRNLINDIRRSGLI